MDICKVIGIANPESGKKGLLHGAFSKAEVPVYYHTIKIMVGSEQFETLAGFTPNLALHGILGRIGFFEHFKVNIDSSESPPVIDIEKIRRC